MLKYRRVRHTKQQQTSKLTLLSKQRTRCDTSLGQCRFFSLSLACPCSWCTVSPSLMYHRRRISSAVQPQYSAEKLHFVVSAVPGIVFTPFRKATHKKLCCSCFLLMPNAYGRRKNIIERLDRIEHTICKLKLAEKNQAVKTKVTKNVLFAQCLFVLLHSI